MAKSEQPSAPSLGELLSLPVIAPNTTLGDGLDQCIEHFSESRRSLGSSEDHSDEKQRLHYAEGLYGCLQWYLHLQVLTFKISEQDWEYLHRQMQPLIENEADIEKAELLLAQRIAESIGSVTAHTRESQQALFTIPEAAEYLRIHAFKTASASSGARSMRFCKDRRRVNGRGSMIEEGRESSVCAFCLFYHDDCYNVLTH
ncbi:MAG: hypothetical protein AAB853_01280 [Patescibacteria group bacterium]